VETLESRQLLSAATPLFVQTNLISDGATPAARVDANLVNPWGIAISPTTGEVWVANNGSGVATVYDQSGNAVSPQLVTIPPPGGSSGTAAPTGAVFFRGKGFNVSGNGQSGSSIYLFDTEDGTISGWNPAVDPSHAVLAVDNSASGAVYKGLAVTGSGKSARLFASNFSSGAVEVYDGSFTKLTLPAGSFTDPNLPAGFAPFGVQVLKGKVYVTYALQDGSKQNDVPGPGNGFVDIYNTKGKLLKRLASGGALNSPWGVTFGVGKLAGDVLVGNFRDGRINIFNSRGTSLGQLDGTDSQPITIDGLWDLTTGIGSQKKTLFFSAGTNDEADGLFGTLAQQAVSHTRQATPGSNTPPTVNY
jgi:uncharacterized protein (TIGR03118 family)